MAKKLLYGVGLNDADYVVARKESGKFVVCPYYRTWAGVIQRCYSKRFHEKNPAYSGVTMCKEWLTFSVFKVWMSSQDWRGKEIDKDILSFNGKVYSPETCCFVTATVNNFFKPPAKNKSLPQGVRLNASKMKFYCEVFNPFKWKNEKSPLFDTLEDAHSEWKRMKLRIAEELLREESDARILAALKIRFSSDQLNNS